MKENFEGKLLEFKSYLKKLELLNSAIAVLDWDARVGLPKKANPYRGEVLGCLSGEQYKLQTSDKMKEFIDYFLSCEDLDDTTKAMTENAKKSYDQTMKIPEDRYTKYVITASNSQAAWEEAKSKSDFSIFKPFLQEMIDFQREFIGYWGHKATKYDTLLDFYEPGITVEKLDSAFSELRDAIVLLLNKIKASKIMPDCSFFAKGFTKAEQEAFGVYILEKMGYDFDAGRLDESMHPFTTTFENKDVRITTHYNEKDFRSSLFSCIHEGGHAIYEQDIPDELKNTLLATGTSAGIHESQSRFYENIIGRSREFWAYFYPEALKRFPQFKDITLEDFYRGINTAEVSFIRTDADELTYSLHIIIRYELEKAIFNGTAKVEDLPALWNEKYREYLGILPENDAEGILQDVHWSAGLFGYFPSYALGNIYGAQFLNTLQKDIPDLFPRIERGELDVVHTWLNDNIHKYGAIYKPAVLLKKITGEDLTAKYFIDYLNNKFGKLYNL